MDCVVSVRVLDAPFHIDRPFDYDLPAAVGPCPRGTLVRVPFGGGNRPSWAVVMGEGDPSTPRRKAVLSRLAGDYLLDGEMLDLCLFLSEYYLCTLGDAVRCVLPPALLGGGVNIAYTYVASLAISAEEASSLMEGKALRSPTHRALLQALTDGPCERDVLCERCGATAAQVKALCDKGYVTLSKTEKLRSPYPLSVRRDTSPIHLSRQQLDAYDRLVTLYEEEAPRAALLYGVTGSGKTKVMLRLIDRVIADGKGAILLVPEISLTPQTVQIFCARYGERVAVIHSSLSAGERFDAWRRIERGDVDLVIGTRSAVFAPLKNIGVIIVDEEHEHTYKSEQDPKYHTRQVCAKRAAAQNALVLLASATPSFESYYKAQKGQYELIELTERYGNATLPEVEIVDMRRELSRGNTSPISHRLFEALETVEELEEQAILFLNRRGYNASLQCKSCGEVLLCPHCSVAMTHHTAPTSQLLCHLCGYRAAPPRACPHCGSEHIRYVGFGTQKVETELARTLPDMRLMRMDADTTSGKHAYDRMLEGFRQGEADVLLGTQMVTKGHDFPRVTLVGVLLADTGIYANDFRASEHTFSLLTQVIGRAGRAQRPGRAVIQTYSPQNDVIRLAQKQDYRAFYESEIELRQKMLFPPFCDMVQITLTSGSEERLRQAADLFAREASERARRDFPNLPLQMFGPMEAQVYKQAEQYRMRLMFKCRWSSDTRALFRALMQAGARHGGVSCSIDINPYHA